MNYKSILVTISFLFASHAGAKVVGKVYKKGEMNKQILTFERTEELQNGLRKAVSQFKKMDGELVLQDTVTFDKEIRFSNFEVLHKQLNFTGKVDYKNQDVKFSYLQKDKEPKVKEIKNDDPVVVGSLLSLYIQKHWKEVMDGETINFNLAMAGRMDTLGFKIEKVESKNYNGKSFTTFKMSASSFLIRQFVDDIYFMFDEKKMLRVYEGRVTVKDDNGGKLKDLDATIFYEYI